MYYWIMLALAVLAEVISTIGMKFATTSSPVLGYLLMAVMVTFSFYAFSRAIIRIPLAISYAIWEGLGLFLIGLAGVLFFGEKLSTGEMLSVALMMFGLILVTFDKGPKEQEKEQGVIHVAKELAV
ncbi:MAG TPA: multidrug efflux SMR transporter [Marinospirillum sp.]|uniref:multidrug efflux SMR transporter n=1 Tax=Marinospirillum sp. TaxID=2183934 RepID=UPI002B494096|nr:multidrug efflux SMR transporter [Marinospirillum sp.]HKM16477.1 multidrug efflux SMR transporter [Marinospirillum sp.]